MGGQRGKKTREGGGGVSFLIGLLRGGRVGWRVT